MSDSLREAAERTLLDLGEAPDMQTPDAAVEHASFSVRVGRSHETVSMRLDEGRLRVACTCGDNSCPHVRVALHMTAARSSVAPASAPFSITVDPLRSIRPRLERMSISPDARRIEHAQRALSPDTTSLAEVLEDMVTAVTRAGVTAQSGLSVQETVARLMELAPSPLPLGISRFVGRLRVALDAHDIGATAHTLHAAAEFAADLRAKEQSPAAQDRRVAWLGALAGDERAVERITDRALLEVAREWVHGHERSHIERRYLVDLEAGEVYCEERMRRVHAASIGPCPRIVGVGLAEAERGGLPRRVRLLQYTVAANVELSHWQQLAFWAQRDFAALATSFRAAVEHYAGFCEPFAIVAPSAIVRDADITLLDGSQHGLSLHGEESAGKLRRFEELTAQHPPAWVAGRLLERHGRLVLRPLALGILRADHVHHERL